MSYIDKGRRQDSPFGVTVVMVSGPPYSLGFKLTPMIDSAAPKVVRLGQNTI